MSKTERPVDSTNPSHYREPPDLEQFPDARPDEECIDYMIRTEGIRRVLAFCQLNAIKYRWRAGRKEGEKAEADRSKAQWYEDMDDWLRWGKLGRVKRDPRLKESTEPAGSGT